MGDLAARVQPFPSVGTNRAGRHTEPATSAPWARGVHGVWHNVSLAYGDDRGHHSALKPKVVAPKPAAAAPKPAAVVALTEDQNLFIQKMEELGEADPTGKALSGLWKANLKQLEQLEKQDIEAHTQLKDYFRTIKKDK